MQEKAKIKNVERLIFVLFTVLFVCIIGFSLIPKALDMISCSVSTDSMEPSIKRGSYILAETVRFEDIVVTDILLFEVPKTGERFVRTVADIYADDKQLVTAGNDFDNPDPMTTAYSCVLGKVVYEIPLIGYIYSFTDSLIGKIIIGLFYIIWAAVEIEIYRVKKRGA